MQAHGAGMDAGEAQRGIRDLMGLLALSAMWLGKDGQTVLQLMAQAVERMVSLRFSYIEASILAGEEHSVFVRADGCEAPPAALADWKRASAAWPRLASMSVATNAFQPTPIGSMRMVRLELGLSTLGGGAWFGSDAPDFPTGTDLAILRAAASLAATGLQAARMQHAQEESDRLKDEFLAMLGHELRNPLAPIRAGAGIWQNEGVTVEQIQRTGAIIERQVQHLTHLVDDLLDVSRLSTGAVVLETEGIDMREVIGVAIEQTRGYIEDKGHRLLTCIPAAPFPIEGDQKRLIQILSNLLNNAAKYTPAGGEITLSLRATDQAVSVCVADNGIGIERDMLARVFELFTQVRRSTDRTDGGLGVGLALARKLVDLHGGSLRATSEGLGHGTQVVMTLPKAAPVTASPLAAAAPAGAARDAACCKVLVVDDNEDAGNTMGMLLDALGHRSAVVHHPQAALDLAPGFQPDVFLLDIGLPGMDGYELARRLRRLPGLGRFSLVALTGFGQAHDQREAFDAGFDFHCTKPVDIAVLGAIFAQIAAARHAPPAGGNPTPPR